jgi:DNA-binding protein HU-beta
MITKTELIDRVNQNVSGSGSDPLTRGDVEKVVNGTLEAIERHVAGGGEVRITGFGTFKSKTITPTNPQTGEKMPPRRVPAFKPGQGFKDRLAG